MPCRLPPTVLDIEASGFGADSYPIEVGVVRADGQRLCRLIKPMDDWTHWQSTAEDLHGISRELLQRKGLNACVVCEQLNDFIEGQVVYTDAWVQDSDWLSKLFFCAGIECGFRLSPLESIMTEDQYESWDATLAGVRSRHSEQRHRASADAFVIQQAYFALRSDDLSISRY